MSLEYRTSQELNSITGKVCSDGNAPYTARKMRVKCALNVEESLGNMAYRESSVVGKNC